MGLKEGGQGKKKINLGNNKEIDKRGEGTEWDEERELAGKLM